MASTSTVPKVKVTAAGPDGFVVTCSICPRFRTVRKFRIDADLAATGHVHQHGRPHPEDEEAVRV